MRDDIAPLVIVSGDGTHPGRTTDLFIIASVPFTFTPRIQLGLRTVLFEGERNQKTVRETDVSLITLDREKVRVLRDRLTFLLGNSA